MSAVTTPAPETPVPDNPLVPPPAAEGQPRATQRWPYWILYALIAALAGFVAYSPLRHKAEAWSLALTAAATVGYVMVTIEIMYLNRRQVAALLEQVRVQREELAQQGQAFEQTRRDAAAQIETAEGANNALLEQVRVQREELAQQAQAFEQSRLDTAAQIETAKAASIAARQTYLESIRARLDVSAPRVSIQCSDRVNAVLYDQHGDESDWPENGFVELSDLEKYWLTLSVRITFSNYGPTPVVIRNPWITFGGLTRDNKPMPETWLLPPIVALPDSGALAWRWGIDRLRVDQARIILGQGGVFGVGCRFEVSDMLREVTDTHVLDFKFTAISIDGSRAKLGGRTVPVGSDNGRISEVITRVFNNVPNE